MKTEEIQMLHKQIYELQSRLNELDRVASEASENKPKPLEIVLEWTAPERPRVEHGVNWYISLAVMLVVSIVFAILVENFFLIAAVLAVTSLLYVLDTINPRIVEYALTDKGVKAGIKHFFWKDMKNFWVSKKHGFFLLNVEMLPGKGKLKIVVEEKLVVKLVKDMLNHIEYQESSGLNALIDRLVDGKPLRITEI